MKGEGTSRPEKRKPRETSVKIFTPRFVLLLSPRAPPSVESETLREKDSRGGENTSGRFAN